jgi:dienelactone hydrolase
LGPGDGGLEAGAGPRGSGWREEEAAFESGGRRLLGILSLPDADAPPPIPAVVVIHGWGSCRTGPHRMLVELCRELSARGCAALRFDLSGRGDSDGDYWDTDLDAMIADAVAAADFLLERTGSNRLGAAGLCSGANVALGAAALDARFATVCAMSALPFQKQRGKAQAARRAGSALRELAAKALRPDTWRRLLRGEVAVTRIFRRLLLGEGGKSARASDAKGERRNLKDSSRDIQGELASYAGRLLFVHGGADAEGLSGWRDVFAPFLSERGIAHRHEEIPGADHDYHSLAAKRRAIGLAAEFLASGG